MTGGTRLTDEERARTLAATQFLDWHHPDVLAFARRAADGARDVSAVASNLFRAVRDEYRYDPYSVTLTDDEFRASSIVQASATWCVPKAILLAAAGRALGIPTRIGFADVRNHLQSDRLRTQMGTDLFVYHGYTAMHLNGAWRKATPAFNTELCERFGVEPLEFDGSADALLHPFTRTGSLHMEYVRDRGLFDDVPVAVVSNGIRSHYASPGGPDPAAPEVDPMFSE